MNLFPAIDIRGGKVVRLHRGDYAEETVYGDEPVAVAASFVDAGATWVHIVDLDAARTGERVNGDIIARVARRLAGAARVQVGGGVRTIDDARQLRGAGVSRVVMGSAAVEHPELVDQVADVVDVAVGLDHRSGVVSTHGWTVQSELTIDNALSKFPLAAAFVITDISRDGTLAGPDIEGLRRAVASGRSVIASGGVGTLDDVRALATIVGLDGVITGKALYEGRFTVAEAIVVLRTVGEGDIDAAAQGGRS